MKYLVIPDIHTHHKRADFLADKEAGNYDKIIYLGDYFDDFGDTVIKNVATAEWLKSHLKDSDKIFLVGNHDVHYINRKFQCSGFTNDKFTAIRSVLNNKCFFRMRFYHFNQESNTLFSHAGRHNVYKDSKLESSGRLMDLLLSGNMNWAYAACGKCRGGLHEAGGLVWCDFHKEFNPIKDLNQIFGHTPCENYKLDDRIIVQPDGKAQSVCLDSYQRVSCYALFDSRTAKIDVRFHDFTKD